MGTSLWFSESSAGSPAHKQVSVTTGVHSGVAKPGLNQDTGRTRICLLSLRLPSDWLSLDKSVFQLVAQTMGARREPEPRESLQEPHPLAVPSKPPWYAQGN